MTTPLNRHLGRTFFQFRHTARTKTGAPDEQEAYLAARRMVRIGYIITSITVRDSLSKRGEYTVIVDLEKARDRRQRRNSEREWDEW